MNFSDLVTDWGGFEKLIATLHESGDVIVEHNVILKGRSGSDRQIDVLIKHKQGLYEHKVVAECKHWNKRVSRLHVDALAKTIEEVGASRGVIFSTKGFQSGAITQARHDNIDLFMVRDLTPEEWGLPGRIVDFFVQILQLGIGNISFPGAMVIAQTPISPSPSFNFVFGIDGPESFTSTLKQDGTVSEKSLEGYIYDAAQKGFDVGLQQVGMVNGGQNGVYYVGCPINLNPADAFMVPFGDIVLCVPRIEFTVGIKIDQSRFVFDRGWNYRIALALENLVNGSTSSASRLNEETKTTLSEIMLTSSQKGEEPVRNGSVMRIKIKGMFPFDEMAGLNPVPIEGLSRPWVHPPLPDESSWNSSTFKDANANEPRED